MTGEESLAYRRRCPYDRQLASLRSIPVLLASKIDKHILAE